MSVNYNNCKIYRLHLPLLICHISHIIVALLPNLFIIIILFSFKQINFFYFSYYCFFTSTEPSLLKLLIKMVEVEVEGIPPYPTILNFWDQYITLEKVMSFSKQYSFNPHITYQACYCEIDTAYRVWNIPTFLGTWATHRDHLHWKSQ